LSHQAIAPKNLPFNIGHPTAAGELLTAALRGLIRVFLHVKARGFLDRLGSPRIGLTEALAIQFFQLAITL
jgi:hypothetical protein